MSKLGDPPQEIGGLPAGDWVMRRVKIIDARGRKQHGMPATLKQVNGYRVVYRADNSNLDDVTTVDRVLPCWSRNPDLKQRADLLKLRAQEKRRNENLEKLREGYPTPPADTPPPVAEIPTTFSPPDPPEACQAPPPPPPSVPTTLTPPVTMPAPEPAFVAPPVVSSVADITITIPVDADPDAFALLPLWQKSRKNIGDLETMLREELAVFTDYSTKLANAGVRIHTPERAATPQQIASGEIRLTRGFLASSTLLFQDMCVDGNPLPAKDLATFDGYRKSSTTPELIRRLEQGLQHVDPQGRMWVVITEGERDARILRAHVVPNADLDG